MLGSKSYRFQWLEHCTEQIYLRTLCWHCGRAIRVLTSQLESVSGCSNSSQHKPPGRSKLLTLADFCFAALLLMIVVYFEVRMF